MLSKLILINKYMLPFLRLGRFLFFKVDLFLLFVFLYKSHYCLIALYMVIILYIFINLFTVNLRKCEILLAIFIVTIFKFNYSLKPLN